MEREAESGRGAAPGRDRRPATLDLVGQWRARLRFVSGDFAAFDDLEFMYVFNLGGTMTESSNYDAAPPVPPAYGIWRQVGPGRFETKYEFYPTRPPAALAELTAGKGWLAAGRGIFSETITVADDGETFSSIVRYEAFDGAGAPVDGGGQGEGRGVRLRF